MEFRILGPLEVSHGDRRVSLPRGRARSLLAMLVLNAGEAVSTERLIDALWGSRPPRTARKALQGLVSTVRGRLADGDASGTAYSVVQTRPPGYALGVDPEQVDANVFRRLLIEADGAAADQKAQLLRAALALWRGPALADFAYEPFAQRATATLEEERLVAIEARVDAELSSGRDAELVAELEALIAEHPFRERLRCHLVLALYRSGRQRDALARYRDARRALVEELGVEPGPELRGLEQAILRQDPALDLNSGTATTRRSEQRPVDMPTAAHSWLAHRRQLVTVIFVDLSESAGVAGSADPETLRPVERRSHDVARAAVVAHGGVVEGLIGGTLVAVFGLPTAHEDDALRAVRAAVRLRTELSAANRQFATERGTRVAARVGVNTGEVVVGDPGSDPTALAGGTVDLAAVLQQAAADEQVLLSEATRRLLGGAVTVEPVDDPAPARAGGPAVAWRLVALADVAGAQPPDQSSPMVGRDRELARLRSAFRETAQASHASRVLVVGEAGIGKSRLALEFAGTVADQARVLTGHCPAYGEGLTFWPLRELLAHVNDADEPAPGAGGEEERAATAQVAAWLDPTGSPRGAEHALPTVRRWLEVLARPRPVIVVLEDLHWAQPTFVDLVELLTDSIRAPVLLLCLARPEFLTQRPAWTEDSAATATVALQPLTADDSERLLAGRLAGRTIPAASADQIVGQAQGVPLFLEQMLAVVRSGEETPVPTSVRALLAARLDRLGPAERDLLRCASVLGPHFSTRALRVLVPGPSQPFVEQHLRAVRDREFTAPSSRPFMGDLPAHAFRHALVQQTAYATLTRGARSDLHERVAAWLEQEGALEEIVGYHLEQAHEHGRQVGPVDDRVRQLGVRAGERLSSAGLRAADRFDAAAAENLLGRARTLLPAHHAQRPMVLRRFAEFAQVRGHLAETDAVLTELFQAAQRDGDLRTARRTRVEQLRIQMIRGPDPVQMEAIRLEAARALEAFAGAMDEVGMSQACYVLAFTHLRAGRMRELQEATRRGLSHAERSGDLRERIGALWWASLALVAGAIPVPDAIRECEQLLRRVPDHAGVLSDLGRLRAMLGEFDIARTLIARARRDIIERMHVRRALTFIAQHAAVVEMMAGELTAAERTLRPALELARDVSERDQISQLAATLSRVFSARGDAAAAAEHLEVARQHAPAQSVTAQACWRLAAASSLRTDEPAEAQRLIHEALLLVPVDMLNLRGELHGELAATLLSAGLPELAVSAAQDGLNLYGRKGNRVGVHRMRMLYTSARR